MIDVYVDVDIVFVNVLFCCESNKKDGSVAKHATV
jgi:hypothetical protein